MEDLEQPSSEWLIGKFEKLTYAQRREFFENPEIKRFARIVDKHPAKYPKRRYSLYHESESSGDEGRRILPQLSPYTTRRLPKSSREGNKEKVVDEAGRAKLAEELKLLYFSTFEDLCYHGAKSKDELWEGIANYVKVYKFPGVDLDNPDWIYNTLLRIINTVDLAEWKAAGLKRRYWEPQIIALCMEYEGDSTDAYEPGNLSSSEDNDDGDEGKGEDEISLAKVTVEIPKSKVEIESGESQ